MGIKGVVSIADNCTAVLRGIRNEQSAFRKDVAKTREDLKRTWDEKRTAKLDAAPAAKAMDSLRKKMQPLRQKVVTTVAIKDMATSSVKSVTNKVKAVSRMVATPVIKVASNIGAGLSKIGGQIKSFTKSMVIPVTVAATVATVVLGGVIKGGLELEQQQVSMEHFIGATNKGMSDADVKKISSQFSAQLRENANATPFETGEVMAAGTRSLAISSGNTKEAMSLIQLAEDMAAASGGTKSLSDAVEALADAKMGEMERLKEFGFKVSADEFNQKGFSGVTDELNDFFGGAATKLATTGSGLLSTIKGKLKSSFADFGLRVVDQLKPVFEGVIGLINKAAPVMESFGANLADSIGKGIGAISAMLPTVISGINALKPMFMSLYQSVAPVVTTIMSSITSVMPAVLPVLQNVLTTVVSLISTAAPVISGLVQIIGSTISTLAPVFNTIFTSIADKVRSVVGFLSERMGFVQEVFATVGPIVADIFTTAWGVISPAMDVCISTFKILFGVVQAVFPSIQKIITSVWNFIKPLVEGIGKVMQGIASGWDWLADKVTGGGSSGEVEVGNNAQGTSNWKGGLTWMGENGKELVNLPRGSQVIPNRESLALVQGQRDGGLQVPAAARSPISSMVQQVKHSISVSIAKLADTIIIREEADIEKIAQAMSDQIVKVAMNMA